MIAEQRTTLAEVNYLKLDSINNIFEEYPNVNNIFTNEDSIYENAVEEEWKKYPHITLAVAEGVSPNESNKEIEENLDDVIPLSDLISVEFRNINTKKHKEFTEADIQKLKEDLSHNQETNSQQQRITTEDYTEKELERIKKGRFPRSYS